MCYCDKCEGLQLAKLLDCGSISSVHIFVPVEPVHEALLKSSSSSAVVVSESRTRWTSVKCIVRSRDIISLRAMVGIVILCDKLSTSAQPQRRHHHYRDKDLANIGLI